MAKERVEHLGRTMAETARQSGVTTSAVARIFERFKVQMIVEFNLSR